MFKWQHLIKNIYKSYHTQKKDKEKINQKDNTQQKYVGENKLVK